MGSYWSRLIGSWLSSIIAHWVLPLFWSLSYSVCCAVSDTAPLGYMNCLAYEMYNIPCISSLFLTKISLSHRGFYRRGGRGVGMMGWETEKTIHKISPQPYIYHIACIPTTWLYCFCISTFIIKPSRYVKASGTSNWAHFPFFYCMGNHCMKFIFFRNFFISQINLLSNKSKWMKFGREMFIFF